MINAWPVLIPPILVLAVAIIYRNTILSFVIGLIAAALVATDCALGSTGLLLVKKIISTATDSENLYLYGFILVLGIIIALLSNIGAANAFGITITRKVKTSRATEFSTFFLSFGLFIDDYLNNLTIGYVMRPLTDRFRIPRAKLAFLVHSMSSPFVAIVPLSSWIAWIVRQIQISGVCEQPSEKQLIIADPIFVYLKSLPFAFYSLILIVAVWFIIYKKISYGPMATHEQIALKTGNLCGGKEKIKHFGDQEGSQTKIGTFADFVATIATLIIFTLIGIAYSGNYYLIGGVNSLIGTLQHARIIPVLFYASTATLIGATSLFLIKKKLYINSVTTICTEGFFLMWLAIAMIFCATIFSGLLGDLQAGNFVATHLLRNCCVTYIPFLMFFISFVVSFCIGSSWGTLAILTPLTIPLVTNTLSIATPTTLDVYGLCILYPCLGAVLSGAVAGNHLSPTSETTVMSSTSSGCYIMDHVKTQIPYVIPVIFGSGVSFLATGFLPCSSRLVSCSVSLASGLATTLLLLSLLNTTWGKKRRTK